MKVFSLVLILFFGVISTQAQSTFTVTRSDDRNNVCISGDCSLREAVNAANATSTNDIINFANSITTVTLTDEITINNAGTLTINGRGANVLTINGGTGTNRIFYSDSAIVTISSVTLTGGNGTSTTNTIGNGGAIYANGGSLTLDSVHATLNSVSGTASGGAVIFLGGANHRVINSTFSVNQAADCGGFYNFNGTLTVVNSTISGNTATSEVGGGFCSGGSNSSTTLRNVTITNNTAPSGPGIYHFGGSLNFGNTIIAGNTATVSGFRPEIDFRDGTITSAGNNLVGDSTGDAANTGLSITYATSDIKDTNPLLGGLQNNGGQTPTHALLTGSPAIDAGLNSLAVDLSNGAVLMFDQRGTGFSRIVDRDRNGTATVDIGAFESQINVTISGQITDNGNGLSGVTVVLSGSTNQNTITDSLGNYSFTVNPDGNYTITPSLANYTFTPANRSFSNLAANQTANFTTVNQSATYAVSGKVTYGITAANQTPSPVSGVNLNATGSSVLSATTDSAGNYQLSGLLSGGNYTITPSKTGEVKGINSLDATRIQQFRVGLITLTPNQLIAADTDGNGTVNSLDATRIQQRLVGIQSTNIIGQWKFVPTNRQYTSVNSNLSNENYEAVLVGEVSGNWATAASFADDSQTKGELRPTANNQSKAAERFDSELPEQIAEKVKRPADLQLDEYKPKSESAIAGASVNVSLSANASAATGSSITIPVTVGAIPAGSPIESFDFTVFYDPAVLQPASPVGSNAGTLSANCSVLSNSPLSGRIVVSGACATAITTASGGVLYNLQFNVIGTSGQQTGLLFNNPTTGVDTFMFNSGNPAANTTNGLFTVLPGPTAASVTVSGRAVTASGRGIRNVMITMTDANGNERTAQTTAFGYYRFDNIAAGETITISAKARRYRFVQSSIVRTTNEQISTADFVSW